MAVTMMKIYVGVKYLAVILGIIAIPSVSLGIEGGCVYVLDEVICNWACE